jgi:tetratricopeptide (TPR) repeat protein
MVEFQQWSDRVAFRARLEEAREASLALEKHIDQGDPEAAEAICQHLVGESAALSVRVSDDAEYLPLAVFFFDLAISLRQLKHDSEAEKAYQSALHFSRSASFGDDEERARSLTAACCNHLGILRQDEGSLEQSVRYYEQALTIREWLLKSSPMDEENLVYLGGTLCNLGNVACDQDQLETALAWYHRSIDMLDKAVPGCDCGCRDMHENMQSFLTGRPSPILLAQQFLRKALKGRAAVLGRQTSGQRYRQIRCSEQANCTVASILTERLVGGSMHYDNDQTLQELKRELLDVVCFARSLIVFDLQAVEEMDAAGAALLLHLRGRLVGSGTWPSLCGLSDELRAATPSIPWEQLFTCYATLDTALEYLCIEDEPESCD